MYLEELSPGVVSCPKCKLGDWGDACHETETKDLTPDEAKHEEENTGMEAQENKRSKLSIENGTIVSWYKNYGFRGKKSEMRFPNIFL